MATLYLELWMSSFLFLISSSVICFIKDNLECSSPWLWGHIWSYCLISFWVVIPEMPYFSTLARHALGAIIGVVTNFPQLKQVTSLVYLPKCFFMHLSHHFASLLFPKLFLLFRTLKTYFSYQTLHIL